ncbi:MAG: cytochrome c [Verrucomicrobiota bacterium]|nr:cytochrome c [Verrucomicrobiota bacterium]
MRSINKLTLALLAGSGLAGLTTLQAAPDAAELWKKNCQKCHAPDGSGKTTMGEKLKLKDYTDPKFHAEFTDEALAKATKDGVKEGDKVKMKAYGDVLSADDINALVAYIRAFKK